MNQQQVIEYLRTVLTQAATDSGSAPRPEGDFVGSPSATLVSGLRLAVPGGEPVYLAVIKVEAFEDGGHSSGGRRLEPKELVEIVIGTAAASGEGITARDLSHKLDSWGIAMSSEDAESLLAGLAHTGRIDDVGEGRYKGV